MASEKQILANRANAKKSTGPRTAAGRAKSSRNSYRHGLSLPMQPDPQAVDTLAKAIAGEAAGEVELRAARALKRSSSSNESARSGLPPSRPSWLECSIPGRSPTCARLTAMSGRR